mgnify:CR=1 FL=1
MVAFLNGHRTTAYLRPNLHIFYIVVDNILFELNFITMLKQIRSPMAYNSSSSNISAMRAKISRPKSRSFKRPALKPLKAPIDEFGPLDIDTPKNSTTTSSSSSSSFEDKENYSSYNYNESVELEIKPLHFTSPQPTPTQPTPTKTATLPTPRRMQTPPPKRCQTPILKRERILITKTSNAQKLSQRQAQITKFALLGSFLFTLLAIFSYNCYVGGVHSPTNKLTMNFEVDGVSSWRLIKVKKRKTFFSFRRENETAHSYKLRDSDSDRCLSWSTRDLKIVNNCDLASSFEFNNNRLSRGGGKSVDVIAKVSVGNWPLWGGVSFIVESFDEAIMLL